MLKYYLKMVDVVQLFRTRFVVSDVGGVKSPQQLHLFLFRINGKVLPTFKNHNFYKKVLNCNFNFNLINFGKLNDLS